MRTKKILSVLMALLMFATMFGVIGAHAEEELEVLVETEVLAEAEAEAPAEEEVFAPAEEVTEPAEEEEIPAPTVVSAPMAAASVAAAGDLNAAAAAQAGWPSSVIIDDAAVYAGGWEKGLIEWNPFTATNGINSANANYTKKDSFQDFKANKEVKAVWEAWYFDKAGKQITIPVMNYEFEADRNAIAAWNIDTGSKLQLAVKPGTAELKDLVVYAKLTVSAPLTPVGETGSRTLVPGESNVCVITLRDPEKYHDLLKEADKILANESRYWESYYKNFKSAVNVAKLYENYYPDDATIDRLTNELKGLIAAAPDNVKLTDWEFLNNLLGVKFIGFFWKAVDVFSFVGKIWGAIGSAITGFFNVIGSILKVFSIFTPIFGLFGG